MRIFLAVLLLCSSLSARAAVPVTWSLAPDTSTTKFVVDGLTIIHRRAPGDLVVANLYLLGGVRLTTAATAGIEPFLLEVSARGTRRYPGDQLRRAMARTGSSIGIIAHEDYSIFGLRTTRDRLDSTWSIYTDRLMHPTLSDADIAFVRENRVAALAQRGDDADALLDYLADSVAFAGHPYGLSPVGTDRSLARITPAELRAFQKERMVTSRMLLVVVGDLSRE